MDAEFYPVTGEIDWEPLRKVLAPDQCDEWMFMMVDLAGVRYYKNGCTREYLFLDTEGNAYDGDGERIPITTALARLEWTP